MMLISTESFVCYCLPPSFHQSTLRNLLLSPRFHQRFGYIFGQSSKNISKKVISVSYGTMRLALMQGNLLHNNENPIHEMFEGEKSRERFQWTPF